MSNIVTSGGNVAAKHSAQNEGGGDGLKTLECLRGRLLSERVASKAANVEAENLGNKLVELEEKLKEETKGRNRAQKRLKSLIKKLESLKIVYIVSDESSSHSTSFGGSELSVSSSSSSSLSLSSSSASSFSYPNRKPDVNDMKKPNSPFRKSLKCELEEPVMKYGSTVAETLDHSDIDNASTENPSLLSNDKISTDKTVSDNSCDELLCTQLSDNIKRDDHRSKYLVEDRETDRKSHQDRDETNDDDSMALVPVNIPATQSTSTLIQPLIAENARVEDVLDTLRYVKEEIRSSMERRRVRRVGLCRSE
ncbi:uncharacterized protein LOC108216437 [Daucus carota subsp. sativus]|uniref:uncharacterized protein LOC108216437 n=1 Tax=Daucus carota subsp. sativus TaxID=79200 RepID=UPI0007EF3425|nr:PREDICTED: uncharacterized protein LOC108216437 isoform X2 [Daucus carota subsp. sativus]